MQKVFTKFQSTFATITAHHTFMPLQRWGIDIVGPLANTQGNYKYAVVAVEYFTKWIEVKPLVNITAVGLK
jgi:hypothetical protein